MIVTKAAVEPMLAAQTEVAWDLSMGRLPDEQLVSEAGLTDRVDLKELLALHVLVDSQSWLGRRTAEGKAHQAKLAEAEAQLQDEMVAAVERAAAVPEPEPEPARESERGPKLDVLQEAGDAMRLAAENVAASGRVMARLLPDLSGLMPPISGIEVAVGPLRRQNEAAIRAYNAAAGRAHWAVVPVTERKNPDAVVDAYVLVEPREQTENLLDLLRPSDDLPG